ncbi:endonuclease/exonuclease/phosphatase family protein [Tunicatimonas pelagia]|uniref:endonuclease/exonuclease/phosphatase family protein n=1 Tax=Tunicatimonas pelagia TaxID=931531 RepID=UPI002665BE4B|nr:endonuclease/exonuclease/phosphatase family protein [Tunicatimonas pelagia]WKN43287.1 endonuclease/exonuclease/phosphatase family protein [Tunicatimonas pelagia]
MSTLKTIVYYLTILLSTLVIAASLLSLLYDVSIWWIKALDFPRLQFLITGGVCLVVFATISDRWSFWSVFLLIGLIASIGLQSYFVYSYTPLVEESLKDATPEEANSEAVISLLIANVYMYNRQAADFLEVATTASPDMILVMETNQWWIDQLQPLQKQYDYYQEYPASNTYGMALYSRYPWADMQVKFFNHDSVPSFHTVVQLPRGKSFRFHGVHPVPPVYSKHPDNQGEKEVALLKVGNLMKQHHEPVIVAGDFNDVAWSNTSRLFQAEGELLDARVGRGLYNTFDATSWLMRWPLDHVYASGEFRLVSLRRLGKFGSDHFPLYAELVLIE